MPGPFAFALTPALVKRDLDRNNLLDMPSQILQPGRTYQLIYRFSGPRARVIRAVREKLVDSPNLFIVGPPTVSGNAIGYVVKISSLRSRRTASTVDGVTGPLKEVDPFGPGSAKLTFMLPITLGSKQQRTAQDTTSAATGMRQHTRTLVTSVTEKLAGIPRGAVGGLRGLFDFFFKRSIIVIVLLVAGIFFILPRLKLTGGPGGLKIG